MKVLLLILFLAVGGCSWKFSLMKDCDRLYDKQYDIYFKEYCYFDDQ